MIVACPKCKTKLKVADEKIGPEGLRVKCPSCATVLAVKKPAGAPSVPPAAPKPAAITPPPSPKPAVPTPPPAAVSPAPTPVAAPKPAAPAPSEGPIPGVKKILVAHSDKALVESTTGILKAGGCEVMTASSGEEVDAIVSFTKPQMMLLDVALPGKILGFDIVKKIKDNPETKGIKIILIGEIHHEGRYRRTPATLHGADAYLDEHEIQDHLIAKLTAIAEGREYKTPSPGFAGPGPEFIPPRGHAAEEAAAPPIAKTPPPEAVEPKKPSRREAFLFDERPAKPSAPVAPQPEAAIPPPPKPEAITPPVAPKPEAVIPPVAPVAPKPAVPTPPPAAPKPEPAAKPAPVVPSADEMLVKARRLARTILADIYLYSAEKVENSIKADKFRETFGDEIREGKKLYDSRFASGLPDSETFFNEEVNNFIALRKKALGL